LYVSLIWIEAFLVSLFRLENGTDILKGGKGIFPKLKYDCTL
jgi:hypothetical protein